MLNASQRAIALAALVWPLLVQPLWAQSADEVDRERRLRDFEQVLVTRLAGLAARGQALAAQADEAALALAQRGVGPRPSCTPARDEPDILWEELKQALTTTTSRLTSDRSTYDYARDSGQTKTAAVTAEGALKPELSLVLPQIEAQVRTIPVWTAVSNQSLEDVAGFGSWLSGTFALQVYDELDNEVLNGTGTGDHMLGLLPCPGLTGPIAFTAPETAADAIARAIAAVYTASRMPPDAIVIDPNAYTALLTLKASTSGTYLSGAPMSAAPLALLWGVPVMQSPAMPAGQAVVGNFRRRGTLYGKNGLRMMASTEHADFFTKNLTALLAELRAVLAIQRPPAFCKVTGLPVPA